jgi:hypothetical protein
MVDWSRVTARTSDGELIFRGRSGIDELIALLRETWREWRFEPERFLNTDEQVVRAGPSPFRSTETARTRSRQRA